MGPYCKYCDTRCFIPTTKDDLIKTDLKATCKNGVLHDFDATYPRLLNKQGHRIGWLIELRRHDGTGYSIAAEYSDSMGQVAEYELNNLHFEEILDFTAAPNHNLYYRLTK